MTTRKYFLAILLVGLGVSTNFSACNTVRQDNQCDCNLLSQQTVEVDCSGQEGHLLNCFRSIRDQSVDNWDRLVIRRAQFRTLELSGFDFLAKIKTLEVTVCRFEELLLRGLPALTSVHLSSNGLQYVKKEWFAPLPSLQQLHLVDNNLTSMPNNFTQDLASLQHLNLSGNQFATLEPAWFGFSPNLTTLDVSHNQLTQLEDSNRGLTLWERNVPGLRVLAFSWNQVANLFDRAFESQPNLTELHMDHNELQGLPSGMHETNPHLDKLHLGNNPWQCTQQQLEPLAHWVSPQKQSATVAVPDVESATCSSPPETVGQIIFLYNMELCHKCLCIVNTGNLKLDVNCSSMNMHQLPPKLPPGTRMMILSHNHIDSLSLPSDNEGWKDILGLDLDYNDISDPDQVELVKVSPNFQGLLKLKLRFNQLTQLPSHLLEQISEKPCDIYLEGNPWHCDCKTSFFADSLTKSKLKDVDEIRCASSSARQLVGKTVHLLRNEDFCPQDNIVNHLLDVLIGLMAVAILAILTKLFVDYRRQKRTGKLPTFFGWT
ncbi:protein singed wings 2-like [Ornithodoros turicata]|uniref:protein singed wings 2-like n=1 Tax=Ornithodoros turicata TaxID=34597 RepID=UPI003139A7C7